MNAQVPVSYQTDPHPVGFQTELPVRPGTSAALTARTIDATVHPPLVRAQEKVAELVPRLAEPLSSPILLGMLAGTFVLLWVASRARFRPAGLLLSGLMLATLTSFRPVANDDNIAPQIPEATPFIYEPPQAQEPPPSRAVRWLPAVQPPTPRVAKRRHRHEEERNLGSDLIAAFPDVMIVAKLNAEMLADQLNAELNSDDQEELREYVRDLRRRLRAEARRVARDR
jgi:hypothetical protein